jgi:hypothetical protein
MSGDSLPLPLPLARFAADSCEATTLYRELLKPLLRYQVCLGLSADEAQDVVQDAFVRATSSALRPASNCFSAPIICASVCLLFDFFPFPSSEIILGHVRKAGSSVRSSSRQRKKSDSNNEY